MAPSLPQRTSRRIPHRPQAGGTFIGMLVGLLAGLVLAVVVAVLVMQSPGPFIEKVKRPGEVTSDSANLPDPNRGMSKGKGADEANDAGPAPGAAAPADGASAPVETVPGARTDAPGVGGNPGNEGGPAPIVSAAPAVQGSQQNVPQGGSAPAGTTPAEAPIERASAYLLQVAAYRSQEDAESTKLRLALVGLEASIVRAEVTGTTFFRVRVGPFKELDEMNRARTRLAENGFDASVIRLR